MGVEQLISKITGSIPDYPVLHKKCHLFLTLPTYLLNIMVSTTQTICPLTYVTNGIHDFIKCCIKRWVHLDLRPNNMLFGGPQPFKVILVLLPSCSELLSSWEKPQTDLLCNYHCDFRDTPEAAAYVSVFQL